MICPKCKSWAAPDTEACPSCGASFAAAASGTSVFERVSRQIDEDHDRRKQEIAGHRDAPGSEDRGLADDAASARAREQRAQFGERQGGGGAPSSAADRSSLVGRKTPDWGIPPDAVPPLRGSERSEERPPEPEHPHPEPSPPPYEDPARAGSRRGVGYAPPEEPRRPGPPGPTYPQLARATASEVAVDGEPLGILNLLLLHAGISPLRRLEVTTSSPDGLAGCRLRVSASPPVAAPAVVDLPRGSRGGQVEPPALTPAYEAFYALDEAKRGQLELALLYENQVLAERTFPVTVQNPNEWINRPGAEAALAGIVTPSAPAVVEVLSALPGDFVAYQPGSRQRVREEAEAVYEGIRGLGLSYNGVPPSFEGTGQKVLFPDELLSRRRGCCIDIAALTAALLEAIGLNPAIVVVNGHAFSGVYTEQMNARTPVLRDAKTVLELVEEGSLLVWNSTTYFDRQGDDGFVAAIESGKQYLDEFVYLIDIAACRKHGFKPVTRRTA